jgi:hypothetical protein
MSAAYRWWETQAVDGGIGAITAFGSFRDVQSQPIRTLFTNPTWDEGKRTVRLVVKHSFLKFINGFINITAKRKSIFSSICCTISCVINNHCLYCGINVLNGLAIIWQLPAAGAHCPTSLRTHQPPINTTVKCCQKYSEYFLDLEYRVQELNPDLDWALARPSSIIDVPGRASALLKGEWRLILSTEHGSSGSPKYRCDSGADHCAGSKAQATPPY